MTKSAEKKTKQVVRVVKKTLLADGIYDMWLETPMSKSASAGQFVGVYPVRESTLLPRPISICRIDKEQGLLRLVYRVVGKGTAEFAIYEPGDYLNILGVLGNGFPLDKAAGKRVLLLAGGIGIPPLLELSAELGQLSDKPLEISTVLGYRDSDNFLADEFKDYSKVYIATEDGSAGTRGNVLDAVRENNIHADVIYACGPMPMLRAVKNYAAEQGIKAYISLEERMACGVGACLGCICKTREVDEHSHVKNARICTEGPVFDADMLDM